MTEIIRTVADLRALGATTNDLPLCEDLPVIDSSASGYSACACTWAPRCSSTDSS